MPRGKQQNLKTKYGDTSSRKIKSGSVAVIAAGTPSARARNHVSAIHPDVEELLKKQLADESLQHEAENDDDDDGSVVEVCESGMPLNQKEQVMVKPVT